MIRAPGQVKCVVWDLDNTLWDGILLEDGDVTPRPEVVDVIRQLDARGVLHSIASRNDHDTAMRRLERFGLADYFLYPQISWNDKSHSIAAIAKHINIGLDAVAFVDDQPFELAEVGYALPDVVCVPVGDVGRMLDDPEFTPRFVTDESARRRAMYASQAVRDRAEQEFQGTNQDFLATLDMEFTIEPAQEDDLKRAEELTVRTNQLNSTGVTYSYADLDRYRTSPDHLLLVASLTDRFGQYGKIGLALVDRWIAARGRPTHHPAGAGAAPGASGASTGTGWRSSAGQLALLIAIGIGLHNFAEGLAIGNSAAQGRMSLALVLIIGFGLHNATEGFGIVAPLAGAGSRPSWGYLALLGLIGGGPTLAGTLAGQRFTNDTVSVAFLALAAGSILYVVIELLAVARKLSAKPITTWGIIVGLLAGFATDAILTAAGA